MNSVINLEPDMGRCRRVQAIKVCASMEVGCESELLEGDES